MLRPRHRHHASLGRRTGGVVSPGGVRDVGKGSTKSGTSGQRTPSIGGRSGRTLWHPRADAIPSRVARPPDQSHVHRSPAHDRLQGGDGLKQKDSPHPRGRPLQRLHLLRWIPVQIVLLPRVRSQLRPRDVLCPSLQREVLHRVFPKGGVPGFPSSQTDVTPWKVSHPYHSLPPVSPPLLRGRVSRASSPRQAVPLSNDQTIPRLPKNLRDQVQTGATLRSPTHVRVGSVPHMRPTRGFGRAPMLHPARGPRRRLAQDPTSPRHVRGHARRGGRTRRRQLRRGRARTPSARLCRLGSTDGHPDRLRDGRVRRHRSPLRSVRGAIVAC